MSKSKFGDPHGCLVGKNWPFGKKNYLPSSKKTLNSSTQDLKIQWEINFLTLLNIGRNALKKIQNSNYKLLYEKKAFRVNFGPREVPQSENA